VRLLAVETFRKSIKTNVMATLVKFLIEKDGEDAYAYFPQLNYNRHLFGSVQKTCYAHIGQHSACHWAYAQDCKKATPEQYADLLKELNQIGYADLKVLN
jgi:hypothetical protein